MTKLNDLATLGQAIWLDYIQRSFLTSGEMQTLINLGVSGMTSNPSIFEKAIMGNTDYDDDLEDLISSGLGVEEIYEALAIDDIQNAADLLSPVFENTSGADGYVSLEVNPNLAHDANGTINDAVRLWQAVDRPNLMIKIPATKAGIPAIQRAIGAGINVNVTLIFSRERYAEVIEAYQSGLKDRLAAGHSIDHVASVASFFISRLDTKIDQSLMNILDRNPDLKEDVKPLLGQAAVANAKLAYQQFLSEFASMRFEELSTKGAQVQRPLWASTSTKNPAYSDILYVQELIGPRTVNTVPQVTLDDFLDHGEVRVTIDNDLNRAQQSLDSLDNFGISLSKATQELEAEGVKAFAKSYSSLLDSIAAKKGSM
jgi:transaldolase